MSHILYSVKTIKEMEDYKQTLYNDELLNILPDGVIIFDTKWRSYTTQSAGSCRASCSPIGQ